MMAEAAAVSFAPGVVQVHIGLGGLCSVGINNNIKSMGLARRRGKGFEFDSGIVCFAFDFSFLVCPDAAREDGREGFLRPWWFDQLINGGF